MQLFHQAEKSMMAHTSKNYCSKQIAHASNITYVEKRMMPLCATCSQLQKPYIFILVQLTFSGCLAKSYASEI